MHALLAKDVDGAGGRRGLHGSDGEQGLHGIVGKRADGRVEPVLGDLAELAWRWKQAVTNLIQDKQIGGQQVAGEVVLHARLLGSEELHLQRCRRDGEGQRQSGFGQFWVGRVEGLAMTRPRFSRIALVRALTSHFRLCIAKTNNGEVLPVS